MSCRSGFFPIIACAWVALTLGAFPYFSACHLLGKQCICSHKPFSQNFILRLHTVPALFSPIFGGDFLITARLAYQHNRKLPHKGKRHFFKNPSGSYSRSQRETPFKGFEMFPNKQNLRFPASPGTVDFERLYIQTPCLPHSLRQPSTKFFPKALTGTSVCVAMVTINHTQ